MIRGVGVENPIGIVILTIGMSGGEVSMVSRRRLWMRFVRIVSPVTYFSNMIEFEINLTLWFMRSDGGYHMI
jgi:hypothetical protein